MLTIYRRHEKSCPHRSRRERRCGCVIWMDFSTPSGERIWKSLGLRDWQAAQRRAREIEADGLTPSGSVVTIQNAVDGFLKDTAQHIESTTLKQYRIVLGKLNKFCKERGYVLLRQLGTVELREFRSGWTTSPRTSSKHLERLKRFFSWCLENKWIPESPAKPLKSPKLDDTDVVPLTEEQVVKTLDACRSYRGRNRERLVVLTELLLATGLRIGDGAMIGWERFVKGESGWSVQLRTAKTGTLVSCPVPDALAHAFLAFEGEHPFWSGTSDMEAAAKNWRKIYTRIFKTAGIDGHPHMFRHTFAKRLLTRGVPIGYVASLLGNTEKVCAKNYAKWVVERQTAVDKAVRAGWADQKSVTPERQHRTRARNSR